MTIDKEELKYKDITETEGYKSWLKLLELVKNKDRKEYSKQALMHADTLKEGLNFLKTQGFDVIQKISQLQKDSPLHEKI